jgi:hypothetical protein
MVWEHGRAINKNKTRLAGVIQYTASFRKIKSFLDFLQKAYYFLLNKQGVVK